MSNESEQQTEEELTTESNAENKTDVAEVKNADRKPAEQKTTESANDGGNAPVVDKDTVKKLIYSLCYLWGILFFLPLIMYADDAHSKRHANEGLILLLFSVIGNVVFGVLSSLFGWVFGMLAGVYSLLLLVLGIIGIVYVVTDQDKELPLLGAIKLIK